ncbi:SufE family protein [Geminisphaera colitermitum]|uniref:SufE family protein n=1 Tax=Geminisphaera colitermitum TaxID=1148786 RepID=UPI0005BBE226|nr:SufE family protein [Geminisphaera colitermitum]
MSVASVAARQARLIEDLGIIENSQERLAAVVDRARGLAPLGEGERTEENRVKACVSAVWIAVSPAADGGMRVRGDADSPLVKGLIALLCEIYDGASAEEIVATEPVVLEQLGLLRDLTPTRRNGLAGARAHIKARAARWA